MYVARMGEIFGFDVKTQGAAMCWVFVAQRLTLFGDFNKKYGGIVDFCCTQMLHVWTWFTSKAGPNNWGKCMALVWVTVPVQWPPGVSSSSWVAPQSGRMVYRMGNSESKMDDAKGVPPCWKTSIYVFLVFGEHPMNMDDDWGYPYGLELHHFSFITLISPEPRRWLGVKIQAIYQPFPMHEHAHLGDHVHQALPCVSSNKLRVDIWHKTSLLRSEQIRNPQGHMGLSPNGFVTKWVYLIIIFPVANCNSTSIWVESNEIHVHV